MFIKPFEDGTYSQFLLTYSYILDDNDNLVCDTNYLDIQSIEDDSLILNRGGCTPEFTQVGTEWVCEIHFKCTGDGHEIGDSSCNCGNSGYDCLPAGISCDYEPVFGWTSCDSGGTDTDTDNNNNTNTTGGNHTGNDTTSPNEDFVFSTPTRSKLERLVETCLNDGHSFTGNSESQMLDPSYIDLSSLNLTDAKQWEIYEYLITDNSCSDEAKDFVNLMIEDFAEIIEEIPNAKFKRYKELLDIIAEDPWALIQDCAEQDGLDTSNYLELYNLPFPAECSTKLFNLGVEFHHQPFSDGNVPLANIDYYPVEITQYPDFNEDGSPDSETEMFQAFRNKFIDLASGQVDDFEFGCNVPLNEDNTGTISWEFDPMTDQDELDFLSNNPIASILFIEADASGLFPHIATDDGAVIVSELTDNNFSISTISSPNNGTQPFSGNRQWGWLINENGNFEFFTRAVDVANISKLMKVLSLGTANDECQQDTYYSVGEATWKNMQEEIVQWVNNYGGQANISPSKAKRVDKELIEEILTSNESIDDIISDCN